MKEQTQPARDIVIRPREVSQMLGVSLATVYRMIDRGTLRRIQISPGAVGILRSDVVHLIYDNVKESAQAEAEEVGA